MVAASSRTTQEAIEPDGWMHTGALARQDAEGYSYVVDRKKDIIITGGLGSQPDPLKGEIAEAYVVARTGAAKDADSILMHCRQHLAAYKVPRAIQFVDDLPKTSTGKVMRRELKNLDLRPD